jgi:hypothetical protein
MVLWTMITAAEIETASRIKAPVSRTARTASAAAAFLRLPAAGRFFAGVFDAAFWLVFFADSGTLFLSANHAQKNRALI